MIICCDLLIIDDLCNEIHEVEDTSEVQEKYTAANYLLMDFILIILGGPYYCVVYAFFFIPKLTVYSSCPNNICL